MRFNRCLIYQGENVRSHSEAKLKVVPKVGVEPTRVLPQRFLRPSRLPFRHFGFWTPGLPFRFHVLCDIRDIYTSDEIVFWL